MILEYDQRIFSISCLKKAAYKFSFRYDISFNLLDENLVRIEITSKDSGSLDNFKQEFSKEVIDQSLRDEVSKQTENIRNLILAHTFSQISLLDSDSEDYKKDVQQINKI